MCNRLPAGPGTPEAGAQLFAALVLLDVVIVTVIITKHKGQWHCRKDEINIRTSTDRPVFLAAPLWDMYSPLWSLPVWE